MPGNPDAAVGRAEGSSRLRQRAALCLLLALRAPETRIREVTVVPARLGVNGTKRGSACKHADDCENKKSGNEPVGESCAEHTGLAGYLPSVKRRR